jgi:mycofactocin system creatininase family protein
VSGDGAANELAALTWDTVPAAPTLLVPIGSCEQHGPHLPIATDTLVAIAVSETAARLVRGVLVAPAVAVSASGEHQGFAGTLSIGTDAMASVLVELVRSAGWARHVVLVNGHGGNADAVSRALPVLTAERRPATAWWPDLRGHVPPGDLHAGRAETSLVLAIRPDLVRGDAAVAGPSPTIAALVERGVRELSPTGVLGDPTGASAAEGARLLDLLAGQLADHLRGLEIA